MLRAILRGVMFALVLATAAGAAAQSPPTAMETSLARDQFKVGVEAARSGDWESARRAFERSHQILPRPITLFNLAGAELETRHYASAAETCRRFLRETVTGAAAEQREAAKQYLARAEAHLAHLQITVHDLERGDRLMIDGDAVPASAIAGMQIPVDPGEHVILVLRDGAELRRQTVTLADHESRAVTLVVPRPPPAHAQERALPQARPTAAPAALWQTVPPPEPLPSTSSGGIFRSPIFWTALVLVAGGATAAAIVVSRSSSAAPASPYSGSMTPGALVVP